MFPSQVADTPHEIPFLNILQHLLRIDSKEPISDTIWDTLDILVHRTTLIEEKADSERILRSQKFSCPHCRSDVASPRKLSLPHTNSSPVTLTTNQSTTTVIGAASLHNNVPPPPPLPPLLQVSSSSSQQNNVPPVPPPIPKIPNPPLPPPSNNLTINDKSCRPKTPEIHSEALKPLPQQETPTPRAKMKTINWNKIPPNKVIGKNNIWSIVADNHQNSPMSEMNWDEMEGLFCQQLTQGSPKLGRDPGNDTIERRSRRDNEVRQFLVAETSQNKINKFSTDNFAGRKTQFERKYLPEAIQKH